MKIHVLICMAATSMIVGCSSSGAARADNQRHAPVAHMDQNAERYRYDYDDGVCSYQYEYDFRTLKDHLEQRGDCRNVPIARYRPQAAITPAYPPPAAAPPVAVPGASAPQPVPQAAPQPAFQAAPSATGVPPASPPPSAPAGISVTPVQ